MLQMYCGISRKIQRAAIIAACFLGPLACRQGNDAHSQERRQHVESEAPAPKGPQQRAQDIWKAHEDVLQKAFSGKKVSDADFNSACDFFYEVTGIQIPTDMTYIGVVATKHADKDFEKTRKWYASNWHRLYWSAENHSVILFPRLPEDTSPEKRRLQQEGAKVWRKNEQAILRSTYGLSNDPLEFRDAQKFFADLTGIELPTRKTQKGLVPNDKTSAEMEDINDWFGLNHNELYWDEETKSVQWKGGRPAS